MATGTALVDAIVGKHSLMSINSCDQVRSLFSTALYGHKLDANNYRSTSKGKARVHDALLFSGTTSEVDLVDFCVSRVDPNRATHHFVALSWVDQNKVDGRRYTIFMAYATEAGRYTVGDYVNATNLATGISGEGYQQERTYSEVIEILSSFDQNQDLPAFQSNWTKHFGLGKPLGMCKLEFCKFPAINFDTALANVAAYR